MTTPLDMRMDQRNEMTAKDIVNTYSESELFHIIKKLSGKTGSLRILPSTLSGHARKKRLRQQEN